MSSRESIRKIVVAALSVGLSVPLSALSSLEARADTVVQVRAEGTAQVLVVDGADGSSSIASVAVAGVSVPISDPAQVDGLYAGDQVSFVVEIPAAVLDNLSADDQAAIAGQPAVNGITQISTATELGISLLQQTVAFTTSPQISALTVISSPATEPLAAPPGSAPPGTEAGPAIGGTSITAQALNQTIDLVIAFAGSDATPWISDAAAVDYIAQVQAWYRQYTGMDFTFTVSAVRHLTYASATICGDGNAAQTEMNNAAPLFGRANLGTYVNPNRVHLIVLEDMTSSACTSSKFTGIGTVSDPSAVIPGYNAGGAALIRISQNAAINAGPLYSVRAIAHELGHNFGFNHSNSYMCSSVGGTATWNQSDARSCTSLEYGDMFDLMGHHQYPGALGSTRKYQSGLLSPSAIVTIDSAAVNQSVTLTMLPTGDDASPQLLYIADSVPVSGSKDALPVKGLPYTVELRLPSNMNGTPLSTSGSPGFVVLRADRTQTWMLQPTVPGLNTSITPPMTLNKVMGAGATFKSIDGMISFTVVSVPDASCTANCTGVISVTRKVDSVLRFTLTPDMNGDGRGEVLAVDIGGSLWMYPGTTSGQLGSAVRIGTGFAEKQIAGPGDVNSDGRADVFAIDTSGNLWLYPGNGAKALGTARQVGNGWTGWQLIPAGDLTGDGKPDLLSINSDGNLFMYAGKGDGTFGMKKQVGNGWTGWQLYAAGDLNGDRKTDILGIDSVGDLYQYAGRGDGTFAMKVKAGNGWIGYTLAAGGDLNGDGLADILGLNVGTQILYVYLGQGNARFAMKKQIATGW